MVLADPVRIRYRSIEASASEERATSARPAATLAKPSQCRRHLKQQYQTIAA